MFDLLFARITATLGTALGNAIEIQAVMWMAGLSIAAAAAWIAFMATQPIVSVGCIVRKAGYGPCVGIAKDVC